MTDFKAPPVGEIPTQVTRGRNLSYVNMEREARVLTSLAEEGIDKYQDSRIRKAIDQSGSDLLNQVAEGAVRDDSAEGLDIERTFASLERRSGQISNTTDTELRISATTARLLNKYPAKADLISRVASQSRNFGGYNIALRQAAEADAAFAAEKQAADQWRDGAIALQPDLADLLLKDRPAFIRGASKAYADASLLHTAQQELAELAQAKALTRETTLEVANYYVGSADGQAGLVQHARLVTADALMVAGNATSMQELMSNIESGQVNLMDLQNNVIASKGDFINIYRAQLDPARQLTEAEVGSFLAAPLAIYDNAIDMLSNGKFAENVASLSSIVANPLIRISSEKTRNSYYGLLLLEDIKSAKIPTKVGYEGGKTLKTEMSDQLFVAQFSGIDTAIAKSNYDKYGDLTGEPSTTYAAVLRASGGREADLNQVLSDTIGITLRRLGSAQASVTPVAPSAEPAATYKNAKVAEEAKVAGNQLICALDETCSAQIDFLTRGVQPLPESLVDASISAIGSPAFNTMYGFMEAHQKTKRADPFSTHLGNELGNIKYNMNNAIVAALNQEIQGSSGSTGVGDPLTRNLTAQGAAETDEAVDLLGQHVVWNVDSRNGAVTATLNSSFDLSAYGKSSQAKVNEGLKLINTEYGEALTTYARAYAHVANPYAGVVTNYSEGVIFLNRILNLDGFQGGE